MLFGFAPDELRSVPRVFVYLLNVCKFFIWLARNDFLPRGAGGDSESSSSCEVPPPDLFSGVPDLIGGVTFSTVNGVLLAPLVELVMVLCPFLIFDS